MIQRDAKGRIIANDLTGKRFGWLTALSRVGTHEDGHATWLCRCACGKTKVAAANCLINGNTKSCGCRLKIANQKKGRAYFGMGGDGSSFNLDPDWETLNL